MSAFGGRPQHLVHDEGSQLLNHERSLPSAQTADISLPGSRQAHNPTCLGQLSLLPPELLLQVLSYVVVAPGSIHFWPPYSDNKYSRCLTLCPESSFSQCWCICRSGRLGSTVIEYIDTALLLVSRAIRHTTLDILFARNHFVFIY